MTSIGELKFEVTTNNRTFIFRAESDGVTIFSYTYTYACMLALHVFFFCVNVTEPQLLCLHVHSVERSEWVIALEDCIRVKHQPNTISSSLIPHFQGYLEHRGLRSKIYTIVISDKVFLYKNIEVR